LDYLQSAQACTPHLPKSQTRYQQGLQVQQSPNSYMDTLNPVPLPRKMIIIFPSTFVAVSASNKFLMPFLCRQFDCPFASLAVFCCRDWLVSSPSSS